MPAFVVSKGPKNFPALYSAIDVSKSLSRSVYLFLSAKRKSFSYSSRGIRIRSFSFISFLGMVIVDIFLFYTNQQSKVNARQFSSLLDFSNSSDSWLPISHNYNLQTALISPLGTRMRNLDALGSAKSLVKRTLYVTPFLKMRIGDEVSALAAISTIPVPSCARSPMFTPPLHREASVTATLVAH